MGARARASSPAGTTGALRRVHGTRAGGSAPTRPWPRRCPACATTTSTSSSGSSSGRPRRCRAEPHTHHRPRIACWLHANEGYQPTEAVPSTAARTPWPRLPVQPARRVTRASLHVVQVQSLSRYVGLRLAYDPNSAELSASSRAAAEAQAAAEAARRPGLAQRLGGFLFGSWGRAISTQSADEGDRRGGFLFGSWGRGRRLTIRMQPTSVRRNRHAPVVLQVGASAAHTLTPIHGYTRIATDDMSCIAGGHLPQGRRRRGGQERLARRRGAGLHRRLRGPPRRVRLLAAAARSGEGCLLRARPPAALCLRRHRHRHRYRSAAARPMMIEH